MVYLPYRILVDTLNYLRSHGKKCCECTLFWCGKIVEDKKAIITSLFYPQQYATTLGAEVKPSEVARLYLTLHESKEQLISQVHSHPSTAFHSSIDDNYPIAYKPGLLSIVVPHYGFIDAKEFISKSAIYEYKDYKVWNKLSLDEAKRRIVLLPKNFENRLFNRTKLLIRHLNFSTRGIFSKLKQRRVAVIVDEELLFTHRGQHMLSTSINLLARCCINIDVFLPENNVTPLIDTPFLHTDLSNDLVKLSLRINPNLLFRVNPTPHTKYDAALIIGKNSPIETDHNIFIDALGWLSYVGMEEPKCFSGDSKNPIGPLISASRGSAEIFKVLLNKIMGSQYKPSSPTIFSALNYKINQTSWDNPPLPKISLNDVLLVGAGAIGNCVAYSLASLPNVSGKLTVIDPERIDATNLNRYALATITELKMYKVNVIKEKLQQKFDVKPFLGTYQKYPHRHKHDLVVITVDNVKTRWDVQLDFPRVILNGGMYADSFTISRHDDFLNKPCLGCLYPTSIEMGSMKYPTISFVPMFAGALLAGEILKEYVSSLREYRLDTSFTVSNIFATPKVNETYFVGSLYKKSDNCGCHCKSQEVIEMYKKSIRCRA
jgi:molybdopterin/thiamine biosynthesis adenylyltransferase/proteasome lid subunit RPN8/RPN11